MSTAAFDPVAAGYDQEFSHTAIGYLQRKEVWKYVEQVLEAAENKVLNILELNCGTGEDALFLAKRGHQVLATDISSGMVGVTAKKIKKAGLEALVNTKTLRIQQLQQLSNQKFDLIFSNFGGLNCLSADELATMASTLPTLLNPNGRLIAVVMSSFCVWETIYFLAKADIKNAFRRRDKEGVVANLGASDIHTWYYSPSTFTAFFKTSFYRAAIKPIGIAVPPSYLNPFVIKRGWLLRGVKTWEQRLNQYQGLGAWSDHYLIDLKLTQH